VSFTPEPGGGEIAADPMFNDVTNNDFSLRTGSPCIGAGVGGGDMGALGYDPMRIIPASLGNVKALYR
jgi:hypothetical protein